MVLPAVGECFLTYNKYIVLFLLKKIKCFCVTVSYCVFHLTVCYCVLLCGTVWYCVFCLTVCSMFCVFCLTVCSVSLCVLCSVFSVSWCVLTLLSLCLYSHIRIVVGFWNNSMHEDITYVMHKIGRQHILYGRTLIFLFLHNYIILYPTFCVMNALLNIIGFCGLFVLNTLHSNV